MCIKIVFKVNQKSSHFCEFDEYQSYLLLDYAIQTRFISSQYGTIGTNLKQFLVFLWNRKQIWIWSASHKCAFDIRHVLRFSQGHWTFPRDTISCVSAGLSLFQQASQTFFQVTQTNWPLLAERFKAAVPACSLCHTYLVLMVGFILRGNRPRSTSSLSGLNSRAPET